ncbi:MAG: NADPH-dependent glutamate synthase [Carboxylicivirga sp.]|jgi:glutamate synthase (NADPH/NADH) small chain|nr:NADPH-dependent glutamate synthase [Carboxylicivirga sp.]
MNDIVHNRQQSWRAALRKRINAKDRTNILRVEVQEADKDERIKYQRLEVSSNISKEQAVQEAQRCLDCANPTCIQGCPVNVNIPGFIKKIENNQITEAACVIKNNNLLPAICGRVCPQEKQCEAQCFYEQKLNKPAVAIGKLERFAADYAREKGCVSLQEQAPTNGIKVAVIGSGPSGLACAGDLVVKGYDVTVYEALHEIGGVLKYGIPEFRLPNAIVDAEINEMKQLGVKFVTNFIVGKTQSFEDLKELGFKAFYVASGAGLPRLMDIPGENLNGVLSSNEYLTRINLMEADKEDTDTPVLHGKNVVVIGGGNTAMDSVRTAKRLGAERAIVMYRRSKEEMPARLEEVHHAEEEGIEFMTLSNPLEYLADEKGNVSQIRVQRMQLGEPDVSGRRRPIAIEGDEFILDASVVVVAVGVSPNPLVPSVLKEMNVTQWGTIVVDETSMQASLPEVFAGGDIVRGGATVILAMGDGRRAAEGIDNYLRSKN